MGIPASVLSGEAEKAPARTILRAYALFETVVEQTLPALQGLFAVVGEGELRLTLEGAVAVPVEGWDGSLTVEDGSSYLRLPLREGGEV